MCSNLSHDVDACRPTSQPILPKAYGDKEHWISQVILVPAALANGNADERHHHPILLDLVSPHTNTRWRGAPGSQIKGELSKAASTGQLMDRKLRLLWPAVACEVSTRWAHDDTCPVMGLSGGQFMHPIYCWRTCWAINEATVHDGVRLVASVLTWILLVCFVGTVRTMSLWTVESGCRL